MKLRKGFVSNSSSSSFICDLCGEDVCGMDMCLSEAEMFECENGHYVCETHANKIDEEDLEDEKDYPYEIPSKFCPICTFKSPTDNMVARYLMKLSGRNKEQIKEEMKKKFEEAGATIELK